MLYIISFSKIVFLNKGEQGLRAPGTCINNDYTNFIGRYRDEIEAENTEKLKTSFPNK